MDESAAIELRREMERLRATGELSEIVAHTRLEQLIGSAALRRRHGRRRIRPAVAPLGRFGAA
ncbi:MAG: hypothetical protein OEM98_17985 [Gammaproteobacteria bacterium]|nr:hypothetical protein [Gammaproteobacteria bacterium]